MTGAFRKCPGNWGAGEAAGFASVVSAALAIGAGGALSSVQTTVLLTVEETLAALKKASSIKYRPPGDKA